MTLVTVHQLSPVFPRHLFSESASLLANRFDYLLDHARGAIR